MVYPVLEFRKENQTFVKVERDNVDFFFYQFLTILPRAAMAATKVEAELERKRDFKREREDQKKKSMARTSWRLSS
jgi:hypothetical protein